MPGFTINTVTLSGNLTRDPEHRTTSGGTSVVKLRIASNERYKNQTTGEWDDRPGYYDITIWKGMADWVASNIKKGDQVVVEGRLRWREWETDEARNARPSTSPPTASSPSPATARAQAARVAATPTTTPTCPSTPQTYRRSAP